MAVNEPLPDSMAENFPPVDEEAEITQPQGSQDAVASDAAVASHGHQTQSGMVAHDLVINVLGTKFSITAGEDPEYLNEVLAQYRFAVANTQSISGMKDPLQVAILTGFLLCDEINKLRLEVESEQAGAEKEFSRIMQNLAARIDQMLVRETHPLNG